VNGILKYFFVPTRLTLIEIRTVAFLAIDLGKFVREWSCNRRIAQKVVLVVRAYLTVDRRGASVPDCISGIIVILINVILRIIIAVEVVFKGTSYAIRLKSYELKRLLNLL
jgi:hypothetical protein